MNGLIRKATLLTVGGLLVAGAAGAGVPSNANSTQPAGLLLVGYWNPPDPRGTFTYTIRDANNVAVGAGVTVVFNFSACTDVRLCSTETTGNTPFVISGAAKTITTSTDGLGQVTMTIVGGGNSGGTPRPGPYTPAGQACVTVTAGGQPLNAKNVATLDESTSGGANGPDLTVWLADFGAYAGGVGPYRGRSDFNLSGAIDGPDLTMYLSAFGEAAGGAGTGTVLSCGDITIP
jgi:hypothetical protein